MRSEDMQTHGSCIFTQSCYQSKTQKGNDDSRQQTPIWDLEENLTGSYLPKHGKLWKSYRTLRDRVGKTEFVNKRGGKFSESRESHREGPGHSRRSTAIWRNWKIQVLAFSTLDSSFQGPCWLNPTETGSESLLIHPWERRVWVWRHTQAETVSDVRETPLPRVGGTQWTDTLQCSCEPAENQLWASCAFASLGSLKRQK